MIGLGFFVCWLPETHSIHAHSVWNHQLGRQLLVSEQTASILSNLVAMALTLVGPRLWILLKALFFWVLARYERRSKRRSTHGGIIGHNQYQPNATFTDNFSMNDNLATIENSHSELGAALDLIAKVFKLLKADRIQLFIPSPMSRRHCQSLPKVARLWNNLIHQPADVIVPFILSAAFIGLFVAQSSSSMFSARILTDKIALSIPPKCSTRILTSFDAAIPYTKQCYHAEDGAEGCNFFYNQTISYIEKANETCPFRGKTCAWGRNSALSFDTGLVDAHFLGINAQKKYQFRRKMLCAPLLPDGDFIISDTGSDNTTFIKYSVPFQIYPRYSQRYNITSETGTDKPTSAKYLSGKHMTHNPGYDKDNGMWIRWAYPKSLYQAKLSFLKANTIRFLTNTH